MRAKFELINGIILIIAGVFSFILIYNKQFYGCDVVGNTLFSKIVVFIIAFILLLLGIIYIVSYLRKVL